MVNLLFYGHWKLLIHKEKSVVQAQLNITEEIWPFLSSSELLVTHLTYSYPFISKNKHLGKFFEVSQVWPDVEVMAQIMVVKPNLNRWQANKKACVFF